MKISSLFIIVLSWSHSLVYAGESPSKSEPTLWEKAKTIGSEVLQGKFDTSNSKNDSNHVEEEADREKGKMKPEVRDSEKNRADSKASLFFIPISSGVVLPSKTGFSATWIWDSSSSLEAEYLSGSYGLSFSHLDIAKFSEKIVSLKYRMYTGNSFNWFAGVGQRSYRFAIGDDLLAVATKQTVPTIPVFVVENQVISLGLGNRWQFDNRFTLGFDWFELLIPVGRGKIQDDTLAYFANEGDRDKTEKFLKFLRYGPTFSAIKLQLGYSF